ncbi:DUF1826 domain-containing protein [Vibrio sp. Isolate23]|uniref:DUF1826 domain-containing protein n=1 Tax=Vibrio sp. Isolate23 TaxID=2908533 RepID=UPI001EFD5995|nr:DUF1826 domain-containing protein [Vibrio sp. Isolate23]MCG9681785.1 DUF1826 domain-containing protein [Vibrio sp. Isolate23]
MNVVLAEPIVAGDAVQTIGGSHARLDRQPIVLSDIYQEGVNIAVWQRRFDEDFTNLISQYIAANPTISKSLTVSPSNAFETLDCATNGQAPESLLKDMAQLVDMFCYLFDLEEVGVRFATLSTAMCPRFHVDQVPCRLVTTYYGAATEWLPNSALDRSKLGRGSNGQPDSLSGLYQHESDIQQLHCGDVALLKGGRWEGNEETALVHRSPAIHPEQPRFIMTLDFG